MEKLDRLRKYISGFDKLCVAYSGGVDSDLVMNVAYDVLKDNSGKTSILEAIQLFDYA